MKLLLISILFSFNTFAEINEDELRRIAAIEQLEKELDRLELEMRSSSSKSIATLTNCNSIDSYNMSELKDHPRWNHLTVAIQTNIMNLSSSNPIASCKLFLNELSKANKRYSASSIHSDARGEGSKVGENNYECSKTTSVKTPASNNM